MARTNKASIVAGHLVALLTSISLAWISGENPRVLLYANVISLFFFILLAWWLSMTVENTGSKSRLVSRLCRDPNAHDRSRPYYKNENSRELAGITNYLVGIITLGFMLGILQFMASGKAFLAADIFWPELAWGVVIAFVYLISDIRQHHIIIHSEASIPVNLGYNASGISTLFAAIFISSFVFLILAFSFGSFMEGNNTWQKGYYIEWITFGTLSLARTAIEMARDLKKQKGSFRLMSHNARQRKTKH